MLLFWVVCVALMLTALAYVLSPLLRRGRISSAPSTELNLEVYRQRLSELEGDRKEGVLTEAEFTQAQRDLETGLVEDLRSSVRDAPGPRTATTGARWGGVAVAVSVPLVALGLYGYYGGGREAISYDRPVASEQSAGQNAHADLGSMEEMVARLEQRLQTNPDDVQGWVMLGRTRMVLGDYVRARDAYARAYELVGDRAGLLADYAETVILANGGEFNDTAQQLINKELELSPTSQKGLWLAGFGAYRAGDQLEAVRLWGTLLEAHPADNQVTTRVRDLIAQIEAQLPAAKEAQGDDTTEPGMTVAVAKTVTVSVHLADELTDQVAPSDAVFVFARAANGPAMPLAVVQLEVKDLPVTVTLDDSMAMMPAMNISNFDQVVVGARISKTGEAQPRSGDLQGMSSSLVVGRDQTAAVTIQDIVP